MLPSPSDCFSELDPEYCWPVPSGSAAHRSLPNHANFSSLYRRHLPSADTPPEPLWGAANANRTEQEHPGTETACLILPAAGDKAARRRNTADAACKTPPTSQ